jgi:hypothetical protein
LSNHQHIRFHLNVGYDQFLAVYQGIAKTVVAKTDDGRNISFPAGNVQRFLNKNGIQGYFEIELTEKNKFISIKKLD